MRIIILLSLFSFHRLCVCGNSGESGGVSGRTLPDSSSLGTEGATGSSDYRMGDGAEAKRALFYSLERAHAIDFLAKVEEQKARMEKDTSDGTVCLKFYPKVGTYFDKVMANAKTVWEASEEEKCVFLSERRVNPNKLLRIVVKTPKLTRRLYYLNHGDTWTSIPGSDYFKKVSFARNPGKPNHKPVKPTEKRRNLVDVVLDEDAQEKENEADEEQYGEVGSITVSGGIVTINLMPMGSPAPEEQPTRGAQESPRVPAKEDYREEEREDGAHAELNDSDTSVENGVPTEENEKEGEAESGEDKEEKEGHSRDLSTIKLDESKVDSTLFDVQVGDYQGVPTLNCTAKEGVEVTQLVYDGQVIWEADGPQFCPSATFYFTSDDPFGVVFKYTAEDKDTRCFRQFSGGAWRPVDRAQFEKSLNEDLSL